MRPWVSRTARTSRRIRSRVAPSAGFASDRRPALRAVSVAEAGAGRVPRSMAGVGGRVAEGGRSAALGFGASGTGADAAGLGPPCERSAAAFVMRRDPHPGQVTMLSGSVSGPTGVWQRGQFISWGPGSMGRRAREASIT